jgi:hypothetical protein
MPLGVAIVKIWLKHGLNFLILSPMIKVNKKIILVAIA